MTNHISIATAIDKNRLASNAVYLALLEIDVINPADNTILTTLFACNNNETYVFRGVSYQAIPFELALTQEKETAPTAQIIIYDLAQIIQAYLQTYGGTLDWPCRIKVINVNDPSANIEIEQDFQIITASCEDGNYTVTFTLGAENPLTLSFPYRKAFRNRCYWTYKSAQCAYSGATTSCDYTLDGANGCRFHNNVANFGGFPGLAKTVG